jgi:hypothetical protein
LVVINGCLQYEKKQQIYARVKAPQTKLTLWGSVLMNNLAFFSFFVKRFFSRSVPFVRVYLYVVFCFKCFVSETKSKGIILFIRISSSVARRHFYNLIYANYLIPMQGEEFKLLPSLTAHYLPFFLFIRLLKKQLLTLFRGSWLGFLPCGSGLCVSAWHRGFEGVRVSRKKLSLFIFNYVITFGKVKNCKALFSRLHLNLSILKVSFWGYKCIV